MQIILLYAIGEVKVEVMDSGLISVRSQGQTKGYAYGQPPRVHKQESDTFSLCKSENFNPRNSATTTHNIHGHQHPIQTRETHVYVLLVLPVYNYYIQTTKMFISALLITDKLMQGCLERVGGDKIEAKMKIASY